MRRTLIFRFIIYPYRKGRDKVIDIPPQWPVYIVDFLWSLHLQEVTCGLEQFEYGRDILICLHFLTAYIYKTL